MNNFNQEALRELFERKLSPAQRRVAKSSNKYLRVVAGAGAGKTTTMAARIVHLLAAEPGLSPKNIVAFTFTERAAAHLKDKIYSLIKKVNPQLCDRLGDMFIGTIHAFCFRLLQERYGFGNFDVLDENQEIAFVMRRGQSIGFQLAAGYQDFCKNFLKTASVVYDERINRTEIKEHNPEFLQHLEKYETQLDREKLLTFGRIIQLTLDQVSVDTQGILDIRHLIVDEYQDINKAQQDLIQIMGQNSTVYVVGDPRQCIYQWRGSNRDFFEQFSKYFQGAGNEELQDNHRSTKSIVDIANKFAQTLEGKYPQMTAFRTEEGKTVKITFETPEDEAKAIAQLIKHLVKTEKSCEYSDCAILLRSVSTSAEPFMREFKRQNIPFIIGGKVGLMKRPEAKVVGMLFAWLDERGFWKKGYGHANQVPTEELLAEASAEWNVAFDELLPTQQLEQWRTDVLAGKFNDLTEVFQELLIILGFLDLDQMDDETAAIMANLGRFNELLTDYQSSIVRGGNKISWRADLHGLMYYLNYTQGAYEEQPADDVRGAPAVQIMTIHQAKGLEWPVVFVPSLTAKRFPMSKRSTDWQINPSLFPINRYEGNEDNNDDAERRVFYVAITRGRDFVSASTFKRINKSQSPSPFFKDIKPPHFDNLEKIGEININRVTGEDELQSYAAGEIIEYNWCPYMYRLRNLWGYQSQFSPRLGFGKSLHHCLRMTAEKVARGIKPSTAIDLVFDEGHFHLPFAPPQLKDDAKKRAHKILRQYVTVHESDMQDVQEVEARVEFPLAETTATVIGRADVIINKQGQEQVRDYKTSEQVTTKEESSLQVQLYTIGLNKKGHTITKGSIAVLADKSGKPLITDVPVGSKELRNAENIARSAIKGIYLREWTANPSKRCEDCDYLKICRYAPKDLKQKKKNDD